ncbi:MAG TPA: rhomboid family intramembrane serine protease [Vicinamibacterales bacterium]|nr:rhomboid family intramembrane serine protease [Vicinamibacterales bacterium]
MSRSHPSGATIQFGPGPLTPAIRAIIVTNVVIFVLTLFSPTFFLTSFGMRPADVVGGEIWRLATYMFVHHPGGFGHILFNMLAVWMFGVDLERRWGTQAFATYYAVTGVGAGLSQLVLSLLPLEGTAGMYTVSVVGASGAVYGIILAWALLFPHRQVLFMFVFPLPARVFAGLMGGIAFLSAASGQGGAVAHIAHLGGMIFGWIYLKGPRNLKLDMDYRLTRWRMERMRRKFDVHRGGRDRDKYLH